MNLVLRLLSALFVFGQPVYGQEIKTLTLEECISTGLKESLSIQEQYARVKHAEIDQKSNKLSYLPRLNLSSSLNYSIGRSIDPFTNQFEDEPIQSQSMGLNLGVPLFQGMGRRYTSQISKADLQAQQDLFEEVKLQLVGEIIRSFLEVMKSKELLKIKENRLHTEKKRLEIIRTLYEGQKVQQVDVLEAESIWQEIVYEMQKQTSDLHIAKLNLKQLLNLPDYDSFDIRQPEDDSWWYDPNHIEVKRVSSHAMENHPVINYNAQQRKIALYNKKLTSVAALPSVRLDAGLATSFSSLAPELIPQRGNPGEFQTNTYINQLNFNLRRFVSLTINVPIFNGLVNYYATQKAQVNADIAQIQFQKVSQEVQSNCTRLLLEVRQLKSFWQYTIIKTKSKQEIARVMKERFEQGRVDIQDYLLTENTYSKSAIEEINAKYEFLLNMKILEVYTKGNYMK
ncbi:MAG: TolC family protein [Cyclobacteriaceae bacterium]|nr:TolC family protein [Cyclobacteriaceae bacterium HetDA_MAG_MS6]